MSNVTLSNVESAASDHPMGLHEPILFNTTCPIGGSAIYTSQVGRCVTDSLILPSSQERSMPIITLSNIEPAADIIADLYTNSDYTREPVATSMYTPRVHEEGSLPPFCQNQNIVPLYHDMGGVAHLQSLGCKVFHQDDGKSFSTQTHEQELIYDNYDNEHESSFAVTSGVHAPHSLQDKEILGEDQARLHQHDHKLVHGNGNLISTAIMSTREREINCYNDNHMSSAAARSGVNDPHHSSQDEDLLSEDQACLHQHDHKVACDDGRLFSTAIMSTCEQELTHYDDEEVSSIAVTSGGHAPRHSLQDEEIFSEGRAPQHQHNHNVVHHGDGRIFSTAIMSTREQGLICRDDEEVSLAVVVSSVGDVGEFGMGDSFDGRIWRHCQNLRNQQSLDQEVRSTAPHPSQLYQEKGVTLEQQANMQRLRKQQLDQQQIHQQQLREQLLQQKQVYQQQLKEQQGKQQRVYQQRLERQKLEQQQIYQHQLKEQQLQQQRLQQQQLHKQQSEQRAQHQRHLAGQQRDRRLHPPSQQQFSPVHRLQPPITPIRSVSQVQNVNRQTDLQNQPSHMSGGMTLQCNGSSHQGHPYVFLKPGVQTAKHACRISYHKPVTTQFCSSNPR